MGMRTLGHTLAGWPPLLAALAASACGGVATGPVEEVSEVSEVSEVAQAVAAAAGAHPHCGGILPRKLGLPVVDASLYAGHATRCLPGITDGQGHVAIGTANAIGSPDVIWTVKPRWGGAQVGRFAGAYIPELLPQHEGWIGGEAWSPMGRVERWFLNGWTHDGTLLHRTEMPPGHAEPDRASGALAVFDEWDEAPYGLKVQRFDSEAAPRSAAVQVAGVAHNLVAAGVDDHGDALVLFEGSTAGLPQGHMGGRWLDPDGAPRTEVFDAGIAYLGPSPGTLAPLYDGSLALQLRGQWVARFTHLSTAPAGPVPAWLAARPGTRLVRIRGGKGYALLPGPEDVTECKEELFLYSKAGDPCGSLTFTVDALPCTTRGLNVGSDGTVVQLSPRPGACENPECIYRACTYSWWPGLLGRKGHGKAGLHSPAKIED